MPFAPLCSRAAAAFAPCQHRPPPTARPQTHPSPTKPTPTFTQLEFNPNDGAERFDAPPRRAHERLIRKLLAYPAAPPLLEVVFFYWGLDMAEGAEIAYRMGGDDEIEVLAQVSWPAWGGVRWGQPQRPRLHIPPSFHRHI
jgi:hypothetical protein